MTLSARNVPIIETERLVMRGHRLDDFETSAAMWAEPEVTRFISGKPSTREEAWSRLLRYAGHWSLLGFGYWALEEKTTGRFAGEVGFADFKRSIEPSLDGIPEIGWVIAPAVQGRGLATEAVRAALAWGAAHFGPVRTACLINPENLPSIRVAEKCGYEEFARTSYKDGPTILFSRSLALSNKASDTSRDPGASTPPHPARSEAGSRDRATTKAPKS